MKTRFVAAMALGALIVALLALALTLGKWY
jgi:hypothetical protein